MKKKRSYFESLHILCDVSSYAAMMKMMRNNMPSKKQRTQCVCVCVCMDYFILYALHRSGCAAASWREKFIAM